MSLTTGASLVSYLVNRGLKAHELITSPVFILMKVADTFAQPTTATNQFWQMNLKAGG